MTKKDKAIVLALLQPVIRSDYFEDEIPEIMLSAGIKDKDEALAICEKLFEKLS